MFEVRGTVRCVGEAIVVGIPVGMGLMMVLMMLAFRIGES